MREVAVIGVGMIKFGRYDKSVWELARDAILEALQDAGIGFKKVEALYSGNMYRTNLSGQQILQQVGLTGIPVVNVVNACATGSTAVREAYLAVAMGLHDIVVAVGSEQMGKMGLLGADAARREESVEGILGSGLMPAIDRNSMCGQQFVETVTPSLRIKPTSQHHSVQHSIGKLNLRGFPKRCI